MKKNFIKLLIIAILLIGVNLTAVYAVNTANTTNTIKDDVGINNGIEQEKDDSSDNNSNNNNNNNGLGLIAVALATGLACIGSGIAVATVGASAVGAISENPKLLGKTIIFAGLAEGIAIYGLIISIMILNKI